MNLYFQFLTQNQTAETARMLDVITFLTDGQPLTGQVKLYAQGTTSRSTFSEIAALIERLSKKRFNELELILDVAQPRLSGSQRLKSFECDLAISPTCGLWFPVTEWRTDGDRTSDNRYRTAKSHEGVLAFHNINKEPSILGLLIEVKTRLTKDAILDEYAKKLKTLPESFDSLRVFGCCDVVEPIFIPQLKKKVVMPQVFQAIMKVKPSAYPELGERFEDLHPLMFGSKRLCKGISEALGKEAKLTTAHRAKEFSIIRLASTCDKESAKKRVADWLITGNDKLT